ncbi:MAG: hypothetical protein Q8Q59_00030 [Luteolibacter sp.]|jgi:capsular polysaccharide biosynthesis protein|nr:hypothetical protein [Luteolibacter sp.]
MLKRYWWIFLVMMGVGPLAACVVALLIGQKSPKQYESQTVIEVKPRILTPRSENSVESKVEDHLELIKSPGILALAAENLKLPERWGMEREDTLSVLADIVNVGRIRGTDLWFIRVRHTDNIAARDIAMGVASAYHQHGNETRQRQAEGVLRDIREAVHKQEDIVEDFLKVLRAKLPPGNEFAVNTPITADLAKARSDFDDAQNVLRTMKLKLMGETIALKIPNESVEIHEAAVISHIPVAPNVRLNVVMGIAAGFFLSPLLAVPVIWFRGGFMPTRR